MGEGSVGRQGNASQTCREPVAGDAGAFRRPASSPMVRVRRQICGRGVACVQGREACGLRRFIGAFRGRPIQSGAEAHALHTLCDSAAANRRPRASQRQPRITDRERRAGSFAISSASLLVAVSGVRIMGVKYEVIPCAPLP